MAEDFSNLARDTNLKKLIKQIKKLNEFQTQ